MASTGPIDRRPTTISVRLQAHELAVLDHLVAVDFGRERYLSRSGRLSRSEVLRAALRHANGEVPGPGRHRERERLANEIEGIAKRPQSLAKATRETLLEAAEAMRE